MLLLARVAGARAKNVRESVKLGDALNALERLGAFSFGLSLRYASSPSGFGWLAC
jgi:hypothetical protein